MQRFLLIALVLSPLAFFAGCSKDVTEQKTYPFKGKVIAIDTNAKNINIDHEDIPGLMKAMKMNFHVEDLKLLEGITPGSLVEGKIRKDDSKYVITELKKTGDAAVAALTEEEKELAEIKANLAKLSPEDRKLAEEQNVCPIGSRLGGDGMGVPVKIMLNGQTVFLCCKGCEADAKKEPEKTLQTIADAKKKK